MNQTPGVVHTTDTDSHVPYPSTMRNVATSLIKTTDPGLRRRTLLARAIAVRDLNRYSLHLVADLDADPATGGGIPAAQHLGKLYRRYKFMAVLCARIVGGLPWEDIADWLNIDPDTAIRLFANAEARWRAGDPSPWLPSQVGGEEMWRSSEDAPPIVIADTDADRIVAELNSYVIRHAENLCSPEWDWDGARAQTGTGGHRPA
jgi:hypothetical protein